MAIGYSLKLPLLHDSVDGYYKLNKTLSEVVRQNIKMIVLTTPGERMMNPDFGVGARNYLFETKAESFHNFKTKLFEQVKKYLPSVRLVDVSSFEIEDNSHIDSSQKLGIRISYVIPDVGLDDSLTINVKAGG
jgi:phage baseplate assembly protein W|tara:strand:+ start:8438 stop:8836 length:399 start_codon:yes stop_codon:yes gene_type:complete